MNYKQQTSKLIMNYEAMFGIQGHRIEKLSNKEMQIAISTNTANVKAPARGSRK
jgi:hypothetical protein